MNQLLEISDILNNPQHWQMIDVRSPGEYNTGHIPGAVNIPLFTDDERARVGTLYKQTSPDAAMKEGLKIVGLKMTSFLEAVRPYINNTDKKLVIHCWRGGKRSEALQWLFNFSGIDALRLKGGYKTYRNAIHSFFGEHNFNFRIIGGYTGTGKTEILKSLAHLGEQVVDLEKLAHHKGSAFGAIGEEEQPSNEQFENNLYDVFSKLDYDRPIWIENESRNIGRVYLPEAIWLKMRSAILFNVNVSRDVRLQRALSYYAGNVDKEKLKESFEKIKKRLGGLDYQEAIKALSEDDLKTAASIALQYYDKSYAFQLQQWKTERRLDIAVGDDVDMIANHLIKLI